MKTKVIKSKIEVQLTMTEEQANWLNAIMSCPQHEIHPSNNSTYDTQMRETFLEATTLNKD